MKEIVTQTELLEGAIRVKYLHGDLVNIEYADHLSIDLDLARKLAQEVAALTGGARVKMLHNLGMYTELENGVREYLAHLSDKESKIAEAIVIRGLAQRIKLNYYVRTNRPHCPTRLFNSTEDALKWLHTIKS
jgi:hypothetical protein